MAVRDSFGFVLLLILMQVFLPRLFRFFWSQKVVSLKTSASSVALDSPDDVSFNFLRSCSAISTRCLQSGMLLFHLLLMNCCRFQLLLHPTNDWIPQEAPFRKEMEGDSGYVLFHPFCTVLNHIQLLRTKHPHLYVRSKL